MLAALVLAALTTTTLAPLPPVAPDLPPAILRALPAQWTRAFEAKGCQAVAKLQLSAAEGERAAPCLAVPGCVAHALEGTKASLVATLRVTFAEGAYQLRSQLVDVATGQPTADFSPPPIASPAGLETAMGAAARRLCAAIVKATPGADLDLDLDLDVTEPAPAPAPSGRPKPQKRVDLDLDLPSIDEPAQPLPKPTPSQGLLAQAAAAKPAPPPAVAPAKTETVLAVRPSDPGFELPPLPPEATAPAPTAHADTRRVAGYATGALAVVAAGAGTLFGLRTLSAARDRDAALDAAAFTAAQSAAERDGTFTNLSWGLAAASAAACAALIALSSAGESP